MPGPAFGEHGAKNDTPQKSQSGPRISTVEACAHVSVTGSFQFLHFMYMKKTESFVSFAVICRDTSAKRRGAPAFCASLLTKYPSICSYFQPRCQPTISRNESLPACPSPQSSSGLFLAQNVSPLISFSSFPAFGSRPRNHPLSRLTRIQTSKKPTPTSTPAKSPKRT